MDTPIQWWRSRGWGARILAILALLYVLYALTVFLILPGWARGEIEQRLSGPLGRDVTVEEVRLNPLTLSATAERFRIADPDTDFLARFDRLYVNTSFWASLFHWRPWVSDVDLAGLEVRLRRGENGALNLDDIVTRLRESGEADTADEPPPEDEASGPPAFTISHLRLSEGRVTLNDVSGSESSYLTLPVAFSIEDLTTRGVGEEDNLYQMHVEGPDGGTLDWRGRFVFEPLTVEGRLQMDKVDVAAFTRLLEPHFPFQVPSGMLGLAADYRYGTGDGEGLTVDNGRFQLDRLRILRDGNEAPSFEVPTLKVDGVSLLPLLKGKSIPDRPLYWHYPHYGNQGGEPSSIIMEGDWKLIHYHEDGRDELYHLGKDQAEQNDLVAKEAKRAKQMRKTLDIWLKETKAKFPRKDEQHDPEKRSARWESIKGSGKERLEKQHAGFLKTDYQPNKDWWGSSARD